MFLQLIFLAVGLSMTSGLDNSSKVDKRAAAKIFPEILKLVSDLDPEVTMTLPEMVNYYGYPMEVHNVITEDGYILTNHRIPHGRHGHQSNTNKLPVLLFHGAYSSSDTWVFNVPDKSLGYLLADAGFDVWFYNCRGSFYSRTHKTLKERDDAFWDFSLDELANYDASAVIDYVINKTGKSQVYIVGHNMGGGMPLSLLADRPEYNKKVRKLYLLSPAGTMVGTRGFVSKLKPFSPLMKYGKLLGFHEFASTKDIPVELLGFSAKYFEPFLSNLLFLLMGPSPGSWNTTRVPIFAAHSRGSDAVNVLIQYAERMNNPGFRHFDWGEEKNRLKYGRPTPPDYDLGKVTVPTQMYYATNDYLVSKESVEFLRKKMKKAAVAMAVAGRHWGHLTYFWGNDTDVFFNKMVADIVKDNAKL